MRHTGVSGHRCNTHSSTIQACTATMCVVVCLHHGIAMMLHKARASMMCIMSSSCMYQEFVVIIKQSSGSSQSAATCAPGTQNSASLNILAPTTQHLSVALLIRLCDKHTNTCQESDTCIHTLLVSTIHSCPSIDAIRAPPTSSKI